MLAVLFNTHLNQIFIDLDPHSITFSSTLHIFIFYTIFHKRISHFNRILHHPLYHNALLALHNQQNRIKIALNNQIIMFRDRYQNVNWSKTTLNENHFVTSTRNLNFDTMIRYRKDSEHKIYINKNYLPYSQRYNIRVERWTLNNISNSIH